MLDSILIRLVLALMVSCVSLANAQEQVVDTESGVEKTVATRIGSLEYSAGFPTEVTVQKLYNELDFQRASLAYQLVLPLVSYYEMNVGFKQAGVYENDLLLLERFLDPKGLALTGNSTTIYALSFLDLEQGPVVVDVPSGVFGAFFDLWQLVIDEVGPLGVDKGKGGIFVVTPRGYTGEIPDGFFRVESRTPLATIFARGIVKNGDVAATSDRLAGIKIYPLSQHKDSSKTKVVSATGREWNSIPPKDFEYWERVAKLLPLIPDDENSSLLLSLLKPLGITRDKPFHPDKRQKQILTDAAQLGWATSQVLSMAPRSEHLTYYPGKQWQWVLELTPELASEHWRELEERSGYYFHATMAASAMKVKAIGAGSKYLRSARDSSGQWVDGSNQYRLHVPPNAPAKYFWSITLYDFETRSMIQTETNVAAKSSYDNLIANRDGSVDLYFGPSAPKGLESNWIQTIPGRGWFAWFRLYGPTEAFFDKSWELADFEVVK